MKSMRKNSSLLNGGNNNTSEPIGVCTSAPHAEMARNSASDEPCEEA